MVRPGREKLKGDVEVDEAFIGGKQSGGKRGRETDNKVLVAIAVETGERKMGRVRFAVLPDASAGSLKIFLQESVEAGSTDHVDVTGQFIRSAY